MRRSLLALTLLALSALPARASATTLLFRCDGRTPGSIEAMENEYIAATEYGDCWFHIGHHTYDIGREVALHHTRGSLFSVEQHFSPPIELAGADFSVVIETSRDGLSWTETKRLPYPIISGTRQTVRFDFDAGGLVARYVRIRQPLSSAHGLSGYIDSSNFDIDVTEVAQPAPAARPLSLRCADDIMERFWAAHPCWFGGINRYDSPSTFHTYPVGARTLTRIEGSVVIAPWRSDDYSANGGDRRTVAGVAQTSTDGVNWTTAGTYSGLYGTPIAFAFDLPSVAASYVRLVPEYHKGAHARYRQPPWKHVRGFIVDSSLTLTAA